MEQCPWVAVVQEGLCLGWWDLGWMVDYGLLFIISFTLPGLLSTVHCL